MLSMAYRLLYKIIAVEKLDTNGYIFGLVRFFPCVCHYAPDPHFYVLLLTGRTEIAETGPVGTRSTESKWGRSQTVVFTRPCYLKITGEEHCFSLSSNLLGVQNHLSCSL